MSTLNRPITNSTELSSSIFWITILTLLGLTVFAICPGMTRSGSAQSNQEVRMDGELEIVYEDSHGTGRLRHFLVTAERRFEVRFRTEPRQTLRTGMRVGITGLQVGEETLELNSGESVSELSSASIVNGNPIGEHRVLVILVNFQDKQTQPFTREQAQAVTFGTTNEFFREASYGQTWLSGDVYGWYTLPISSATCDTTAISNYAQQAAAGAGANLASYNHLVYAFPQNACTWQGRGSVGGSPSQAWVNEWFELGIVGHELGHNFGLYHSRSMDCGSLSVGENCTIDEYGDLMDLMGGANSAHFNLFQKERLGWINGGGNPPITTVTASGTYWIDRYATESMNSKGLKILKSIDAVTGAKTWYYVEYRSSYGFDSFLSGNQNVLNGVLIRTGSDSSGQATYLLDMTPVTASWYDPALSVGQTFTDPDSGVTITTVSVGATGAIVDVAVPAQPCVRANPTLTLAPSQSAWLVAGATATFNVSLRNNDSTGCNEATFNWQAGVPAGWTAGFASPTTPVAPGATGATTIQITSPTGAADGFYGININATNGSNPSYSVSAPATYSLVSVLSITTAPTQATFTRNQTATVNATVKAAGTIVPGATVTFTMTRSNGTTVTSTATTGSNGVAVFKYSFNRKKDPAGTYQVRAQASANGLWGSATTSFGVK